MRYMTHMGYFHRKTRLEAVICNGLGGCFIAASVNPKTGGTHRIKVWIRKI